MAAVTSCANALLGHLRGGHLTFNSLTQNFNMSNGHYCILLIHALHMIITKSTEYFRLPSNYI